MYPIAFAGQILTSLLLVVPLLGLARSVRRLPGRPDGRSLRRTARTGLVWSWAAGALLVLQVAAALLLLAGGPSFAVRPLRELLVLAAPLGFTAVRTLPVLRGLARHDPDAVPVDALRHVSAAPRFALPPRLLAVAGGAGAVLALAVPALGTLFATLVVFAAVAVVTAVDVVQRGRRAAGHPATPRWSPVAARLAAPVVLVLATAGCGAIGMTTSRPPAALNMGSGSGVAPGHTMPMPLPAGGPPRSVADLTGGPFDGPVRRFTITAQEATVPLSDGAKVAAWTFGGGLPGAPIRVRQGDVVEVTLVNHLTSAATTIHWHGLDVPAAEDGVAGITQNAVGPGGTFTYRFQVNQVGTFWYHSHEVTDEQVKRGLFGLFVVEPAAGTSARADVARAEVDDALLVHTWQTDRGSRLAFGTDDGVGVHQVRPGATVRLRVVNADSGTHRVEVTGAPWRLVAVDGQDLNEPGTLGDQVVALGGGGRGDVELTMPDHPVLLSLAGERGPGYVLSPDGKSTVDAAAAGPDLDLGGYGVAAPTPFGLNSPVNEDEVIDLDQGFGFHAGGVGFIWTMNGASFPDAPMIEVHEGDLVRITYRNRSLADHPMHLHGHRVLVLARDGVASHGSPLWMDTVLVRPGETVTVEFRADNPGIWMAHCHNLDHAASGMTMHLVYTGVTTPYTVGSASGNDPE